MSKPSDISQDDWDAAVQCADAVDHAYWPGVEVIARAIGAERSRWLPIDTAPKRGDFLVYQPIHQAGRSQLPPRICLNSDAGFSRQATLWHPIKPPTFGADQ